jgi:molybdopterin-guanine dinucleotide biosynthesis protein A
MGFPKALLPFGEELMLQRVVRLLGEVVSPVVVVAAQEQSLPSLPAGTIVTFDRQDGRGPLEGLRAGFAALNGQCEAAYVASCDAPRLNPKFVRRMIDLLGGRQIAVPWEGEFGHPLAAVYRLDVLPAIEKLLAAELLRPGYLFSDADTLRVSTEDLRGVDPTLSTLANLNRPEDYLRALAEEGLPPSAEVLAALTTKE